MAVIRILFLLSVCLSCGDAEHSAALGRAADGSDDGRAVEGLASGSGHATGATPMTVGHLAALLPTSSLPLVLRADAAVGGVVPFEYLPFCKGAHCYSHSGVSPPVALA